MSFVSKLKGCFYITAFSLLATNGLSADATAKSAEYMPNFVRVNSKYSQEVTNPYLNTGNKYLTVMKNRKDAGLMDQSLYLGVFAQASADFVKTNVGGKVALSTMNMGSKKNASDVTLSHTLLGVTGTMTPWATGYAELAYFPVYDESIHASQAFVVLGDLDNYPVYAAVGKSYVPFGHFDSLSGVHSSGLSKLFFQTVAQNVTLGYSGEGFEVAVSALRSGLRNEVQKNISRRPTSEIDAFSAAASYTDSYANGDWYVGAGWMNQSIFDFDYKDGTSVIPDFSVFDTFGKKNGAWDLNAGFTYDDFSVRGEYVATDKKWPAVAHKVEAFEVEGSYDFNMMEYDHRFTLGWSEMVWMKGALAKTELGSSDQKKSTFWSASWVASLHENLSAFVSWDHAKSAQVATLWAAEAAGNAEGLTAPVVVQVNKKALKTDTYKVGVQYTF